MQQHPLDYERPPRAEGPVIRRVFGRIVLGAWAFFAVAFVFAGFNSSDRAPLQWEAAIFAAFAFMAAAAVTVLHWLVLVPALWLRSRRAAGRP